MTRTVLQLPLLLIALMALAACSATGVWNPAGSPADVRPFGATADGTEARLFVLRNGRGTEAHLTDFGATLVAMSVADRDGERADVVLGFDDVSGYESDANQYFGSTVGRVANRVARGRFTLEGRTYQLATNNDPNHLHGGDRGYSHRMWRAEPHPGLASVTFRLTSEDGDEGYPGRVDATVTYSLTESDELVIEYRATSDQPTPLNLTHHSYFNLAGAGSASVLDHELQVMADLYTPADDTLIPTGAVESVAGTPLDFRAPEVIGARIGELDDTSALGYDHNYAVRASARKGGAEAVMADGPVAVLRDPLSGRTLELYSDQPGLQFYSGNFLKGARGKGGKAYAHRSACCLETQGYPNAINEPGFPSVLLMPGEEYRQFTVHRFIAD
jgi:aldose 1-epimerase